MQGCLEKSPEARRAVVGGLLALCLFLSPGMQFELSGGLVAFSDGTASAGAVEKLKKSEQAFESILASFRGDRVSTGPACPKEHLHAVC
eukprot:jgi/Mesen1/10407/ME000081S09800